MHVFRSMTVQELNTLHTVCELERNQLLTILAMSVQNPQLAGFLLTGNRSNFLYVEGSTAWLYDCPHFLSPSYKSDRCFDRIPIHLKDTLMYVDLITRQIYDYATPIACDNSPRNIIELQYDLTLSQLRTLAYIILLNLINSGTEFYFPNRLILHSSFKKKLLVTPSSHLTHLNTMQILLMKIPIILYALVYMTNS